MVDQILDIHDETIRVGTGSTEARMSGSAVLGGKVTDFLDLPAVLRATDGAWSTDVSHTRQHRVPVLVADASPFSRGLIRNYLELAGYDVLEATDGVDALSKLDRCKVGAVVTALAPGKAKHLVEEMRRRPALSATPVVNLGDASGKHQNADQFQANIERFDRDALLESLQRLSEAVGLIPVSAGDVQVIGSGN
jgi:CheY-like chemotaxis protein